MFNFFNPPAPKPRLSQDKIPAKYAQMRLRVFLGAFLGYAAYYLVRKNLSLAAPGMIESGLLDKASVGLAGSAISIAYAFSKFIMGSLSDRSDARKFPCRRTYSLIVADDLHGTDPLQPHKSRHQRRHYLRSDAAGGLAFGHGMASPAGVSWPTGSPRTNAVSKCRYGIRRTRSAAARWDCS